MQGNCGGDFESSHAAEVLEALAGWWPPRRAATRLAEHLTVRVVGAALAVFAAIVVVVLIAHAAA
jgi:hypothetical protein